MRNDERKPLSTRDIVESDPRLASERTAAPSEGAVTDVNPPAGRTLDDSAHDMLFANEETSGYRSRWEAIQTGFVDEPRAAVEQADALVAQVVNRLAEVFSRERETLEQQWGRGDNVSTEDLRIALKRYRTFFDRLLSV